MTEQGTLLPGQRLRAEREHQGLTEEQAADRMNLSVTYLKALEADDYERLPQATFIKGYIRNYARLLGLPSDELANTFQQLVDEEKPRHHEESLDSLQPRPKRPANLTLMGIGVALIAIVLLLWWSQIDEGQSVPPTSDQAATTQSQAGQATQQPAPATGPEKKQADRNAPAKTAESGNKSSTATSSGTQETKASPTTQQQSVDHLTIQFSKDCWVEVTDGSGTMLYQGVKSGGGTLGLQGQAPFSVKVGNAAGVDSVKVNGKLVTIPSSAAGDVVHFSAP